MDALFKCPHDGFIAQSAQGWKSHMSKSHKGYTEEESKAVGLSGSSQHLKGLAGYPSLEEARAAAPATEGEGQPQGQTGSKRQPVARSPRLTADEQKTMALRALFEQNKPIHIRRWERKIRIVHQLNCIAFAGTMPDDAEIKEGAELHYEMCMIMEWFTYSKYEVLIDVGFWWVKSLVAHNPYAQALIQSFREQNMLAVEDDPAKVIPIDDKGPVQ
jgi:hypothetical protein